jgi:ketosteroid isomerase-like protein
MEDFAAVIREGYEAFNRGEVDALLALLHPDVVWMPPPTSVEPQQLRGREAVREYLRPNIFDVQTAEPLETIEHGDRLMVVARVRARGRGSGLEIDQIAYHVLTVADGLAVRVEAHVERAAAEAALRAE